MPVTKKQRTQVVNNLAVVRNQVGVTQAGLAELMHVSRGTVNNWEASRKFPSVMTVNKLLDVYDDLGFEVSVDDLYTREAG